MVSLILVTVYGWFGSKYRFVLSRHMMRGDEESLNQHGTSGGDTENRVLCYSSM